MLLALLLAIPANARAGDPTPGTPPGRKAPAKPPPGFAPPPPADPSDDDPDAKPPPPGPDPGDDLYKEAVEKQEKGQYRPAQKLFKKLIEQFPTSKWADEADDRSASNAFLGVTEVRTGGPSDRRIDVALMGDGYPLDEQVKFEKAAEGELALLFGEPFYAEYEPYFNVWRFSLASKDKGVDQVGPDPSGFDATDKKKYKKHIREFSTASL